MYEYKTEWCTNYSETLYELNRNRCTKCSEFSTLIYNKIKLIFKYIPKAWVQIVTNGSLLIHKNHQKLLNLGISEIRISIEGNNKIEYEKIRRGLSFDLLLKNMSCLKNLRDSDKRFQTQLIVTGLNLKNYPLIESEYKNFWNKYSDKVLIRDEHILRLEKNESILQKFLPCPRLFTTLPILVDGQCSICIYDWYGKMTYTNLNNNTIYNAWFAPKLLFYKIIHLIGLKKTIKFCRSCSYRPNYNKLFNK